MPADSNWKTPMVLAFFNRLKVFWSSKGISSREKSGIFILIKSSVSFITVRVRSPRISIFNKPKVSSELMSYWVSKPELEVCNGTKSVKSPS